MPLPRDRIHDVRSPKPHGQGVGHRQHVANVLKGWGQPADVMPTRTARRKPLVPRVDYGLWVVDCPSLHCTGAELLDPQDLVFFCLSCFNRDVGGAWLAVALPEDRDEIEAVLLAYPQRHRHWHEGLR